MARRRALGGLHVRGQMRKNGLTGGDEGPGGAFRGVRGCGCNAVRMRGGGRGHGTQHRRGRRARGGPGDWKGGSGWGGGVVGRENEALAGTAEVAQDLTDLEWGRG